MVCGQLPVLVAPNTGLAQPVPAAYTRCAMIRYGSSSYAMWIAVKVLSCILVSGCTVWAWRAPGLQCYGCSFGIRRHRTTSAHTRQVTTQRPQRHSAGRAAGIGCTARISAVSESRPGRLRSCQDSELQSEIWAGACKRNRVGDPARHLRRLCAYQ